MVTKRFIRALALAASLMLAAFSTLSCEDRFWLGEGGEAKGNPLNERTTSKETRKALILYMAGFNSLSSYMQDDFKDLMGGWLPGNSRSDDVLLVFSKLPVKNGSYTTQTEPVLIRLYSDDRGTAVADTIWTMAAERRMTDPSTMKEMLTYVRKNLPARSYGLIINSHATGWLPNGYYANPEGSYTFFSGKRMPFHELPQELDRDHSLPMTKSVCQDREVTDGKASSYEMELTDFAAAIPMHLDYILFDACLMGGIETAYQLKDICSTVGFSQAEVLAEGLDYKTLTTRLLQEREPDVQGVCEDYFAYYQAQTGSYQSATYSLVDCTQLEGLASVCKSLFSKYEAGLAKVDPDKVQGFFRYDRHYFYDLYDIVDKAGASDSDLRDLQSALDACILYKAATKSFISSFDINVFSGFSMYLPCAGTAYLNTFYKTLAWNDASGLVK